MSRLIVVTGPPAAGKTTYVREHAETGDVIVDRDALALALGAEDRDNIPGSIKSAARIARNAIVEEALDGRAVDTWVIYTSLTPGQEADYTAAQAEFVELDPGLEETLRRAAADGRPDTTEQLIRDWYQKQERKTMDKQASLEIRKRFAAKVETATEDDEEDGIVRFTAIVSVFGNLDLQGDVIEKGAYADSIERFEAGEKIAVVWSHDIFNPESIIGELDAMEETEEGLKVGGIVDTIDNPRARLISRHMKAGRVVEFSVGGTVPEDGWRLEGKGQDAILHITKMDLWETGPCFRGANPETQLLSVKALTVKAGRILAKRHVDNLTDIHDRLGSVIESVQQDDEDGEGDTGKTAPDTQNHGQDEQDESGSYNEPSRLSKALQASLVLLQFTTTAGDGTN